MPHRYLLVFIILNINNVFGCQESKDLCVRLSAGPNGPQITTFTPDADNLRTYAKTHEFVNGTSRKSTLVLQEGDTVLDHRTNHTVECTVQYYKGTLMLQAETIIMDTNTKDMNMDFRHISHFVELRNFYKGQRKRKKSSHFYLRNGFFYGNSPQVNVGDTLTNEEFDEKQLQSLRITTYAVIQHASGPALKAISAYDTTQKKLYCLNADGSLNIAIPLNQVFRGTKK